MATSPETQLGADHRREQQPCSPIEAAWEEYHGPIDDGGGETYIPTMPPAFRRGFVDGYEHALTKLKPAGDEMARIINIGAEEPVENWATDPEMDRAVKAWADLFSENAELSGGDRERGNNSPENTL